MKLKELSSDSDAAFSSISGVLAWDLNTFTPAEFNDSDRQENSDLEAYLSASTNDNSSTTTRNLLIIPQWHSHSPLSISTEGVETLISHLPAFQGLRHVLRSFTPANSDCYVHRSGSYFNTRSHSDDHTQRFESCCFLKFVEMNGRERLTPDDELGRLQNEVLRWSVRRQGFYLLHSWQDEKTRDFTILVNPSDHLWHLVKEEYGNTMINRSDSNDWATMIILVFKSLMINWSSYISCVHEVVHKILSDAAATDPRRPIMGEANTQSLQVALSIAGRLQTAAHVLESNILTMKHLHHEVSVRQDLERDKSHTIEKQRISECCDSVIRELDFQRSHVLVLTAKLESVTTMVRDLVNLRNTYTTETLTARTVTEAHTMRVIALLTLCFLPPTFVAGFLDMGYIDIKSERGMIKLDLKPGVWVYLAISLPLVVVILSTYLLWDRRNMRNVARQGSIV